MPNPLATIGNVKPATRERATELATRFPALTVMWGFNPGGSEHGTGRALDLMVFQATALGNDIADYLWVHRARLDLTHLIWRQRIRSTVKRPGVWRAMEDRGNATKNHMDHVHVLFGTKAYAAPGAETSPSTSGTTGSSTVPPFPGVELRRRSTGAHVTTVQTQLRARGWTIDVDGSFGPDMERVILTFQRRKGLKATGVVDAETWAAIWRLPVT